MAEKEGEIVEKGHDECLKPEISVLSEFELPLGLLPLVDVIEVGFIRGTVCVWIVQKKKVEHTFEMIGKLVSYNVHTTGYIEKTGIKRPKGVTAKELMLWITVDDPPFGKIHFKSRAGITKTSLSRLLRLDSYHRWPFRMKLYE